MTIEISIPGLPKTYNAIGMKHWRAKSAESYKWHREVLLAINQKYGPIRPMMKRAIVTLTRHTSKLMDGDGLAQSFKYPLDGLVLAGILEDDSWAHIGMPNYRQEKAPPKQGFITLKIEELREAQQGQQLEG